MLRLSTLGGLDLSAGDGHVHPLLSQPKRLGLLVYLASACAHGYRRRDTILPLFWPELDENRARGALRQAVHVLRRDLGAGVIRMRGEDELGVDPAALWVDTVAFETALAAGEHRFAADLYRGDFLDGFFVHGSGAEFDEWVAAERSRLRALASRTMWRVAEAAVGSEPAAAAGWIRRALTLAPDDELAVRQALERLMRIGDRAGALQLFHEFRGRLDREYQAEPATETKAMGEALRVSLDPAPVIGHDAVRGNGVAAAPADLPAQGTAPFTAPPALSPTRAGRTRPGRLAIAGVLAVVLVVLGWSVSRIPVRVASARASSGLRAGDQILVGDVEAQPPDSLTAAALTVWLRRRLADSKTVRVVSRAEVNQSLVRMRLPTTARVDADVAREIARRNGYAATLSTRLTPLGHGYVLSAHLTSVTGVELATATEAASSADAAIPALDRLTRALRSRLGESQRALVALLPLEQVTTGSMRALELFTQAQSASNVSAGRGQQPPELFSLLREALAIDSTFAMAHRRLGAALHNLGYIKGSTREFRAAERFSDRLTDVERLMALVSLHTELGEPVRAAAEGAELLRLDPGNLFARNWLTIVYLGSGQYDVAEKVIPAIAPVGNLPFWSNLRAYQGRSAEALDSARAFYRRYQDSTGSRWLKTARNRLAAFHAVRFEYDSALLHAQPRDASDGGSQVIVSASRFARGELGQAIAVQGLRELSADGLADDEAGSVAVLESYTALAMLLSTGDRAAAGRRLDRALADTGYRNRDPADRQIRPVLALALAGRSADARRELAAIEHASNADVRVARKADLLLARGAVALSEHRPAEAVAALRRASTITALVSGDACRVCALPWLGRTYEAAGRPDSAAAVYERYLSTGDPFRVLSDAAWRAFILRRLGELHAQRGDTVQAVKRLSEFVEAWHHADPGLQPEVRKARLRVAQLRGDPRPAEQR